MIRGIPISPLKQESRERSGNPANSTISDGRSAIPDLLESHVRECVQYAMDVVALEDIHLSASDR